MIRDLSLVFIGIVTGMVIFSFLILINDDEFMGREK